MSSVFSIGIMALVTALATLAASSTDGRAQATSDPRTEVINGLKVDVWRPAGSGPFPLVLFSHGLCGCRDQSTCLLRAFAQNGFLVVAADHKDNRCGQQLSLDDILSASQNPSGLSEPAFADRRNDMEDLRSGVLGDRALSALIDANKIVVVGHSLGDYTALTVAGAHPNAKMSGVVGVIALAPYTAPLQASGTIGSLSVPVLLEVGNEDPEAYEEAGLIGRVRKVPLGTYSYEKQLRTGEAVACEVTVFPLMVQRHRDRWPEMHQRERRWFCPEEAAEVVAETGLRHILRGVVL